MNQYFSRDAEPDGILQQPPRGTRSLRQEDVHLLKQRQWFPEGVNELARSRSRCGYGQLRLLHLGVEKKYVFSSSQNGADTVEPGQGHAKTEYVPGGSAEAAA